MRLFCLMLDETLWYSDWFSQDLSNIDASRPRLEEQEIEAAFPYRAFRRDTSYIARPLTTGNRVRHLSPSTSIPSREPGTLPVTFISIAIYFSLTANRAIVLRSPPISVHIGASASAEIVREYQRKACNTSLYWQKQLPLSSSPEARCADRLIYYLYLYYDAQYMQA